MAIYESLNVKLDEKEMISFVGGGGKTTTIFQMAQELAKLNKRVLISTTTRIFIPLEEAYDDLFLMKIDEGFIPAEGSISLLGKEIKEEKLIGVSEDALDQLFKSNLFDYILVEADGAKRKPIKAPRYDEPLIPQMSSKTVGVIGLDALGKTINDENVHRVELFLELSGKKILDIIDEEAIINLVVHKEGIFKNSYGDKILLLNKAEHKERLSRAVKIREQLRKHFHGKIVIGNILNKRFY